MINLLNKNIIITGAGSGIGKRMAYFFAKEKANLAIIDINREAAAATLLEVKESGIKAASYVCDISNKIQVAGVIKKIRKDFSTIDVLVNNAGIVYGKSFLDLSLEEMERTMNINFWGHILFTKEFLPDMVKRNSGTVVNIASAGGILGMPFLADYCASKFAEVGFSESLRRELAAMKVKGVNITCVCPYIIDTGMFKGFKQLLFQPFLKPDEVAKKVVRAVKKEIPTVMLPAGSMFLMRFCKLFPTVIFDGILTLFGSGNSMKHFEGRTK
ncbi:MAG: SDR family oxidoreductase [Spirochaetes bacterium]|nr:SDR family oxidoreductase [Spirochaetota bacterium]